MTLTLELDPELVAGLMFTGKASTEQEAITQALHEMYMLRIQRAVPRNRPVLESDLMQLWGMGWEGDLDEMRRDDDQPSLAKGLAA